ncbi:MAG TPA: hypothetical protein VIM56_12175 [Rhizomicrobium sp.]
MTIKLKLKTADFEIEFEGDPKIFTKDIMDVLSKLDSVEAQSNGEKPKAKKDQIKDPKLSSLSTNTIASKLGCNSGSDLVMAAAAYLGIVEGKPTFTRQEITTQMRSAHSYFKETYTTGNLSTSLKRLSKSRLNLTGKDTYSLPTAEKASLESRLGSA